MEENKKPKLFEKISLKIRKKWLGNRTMTFVISIFLIAVFIGLNLIIETLDLPKIDVTENKINTLSKASKDAVSKVTEDIHIYVYGFYENSSLIHFLKQYNKANPKITYEILTEETNPEKIRENNLSAGYEVLILESKNSKKVIDTKNEFYSYDYTTYQQVDTTEQTITNAILALNVENKPHVYFMQGHGEFTSEELSTLTAYLGNEAYQVDEISLLTVEKVPDDCKTLIMMSPESDLLESEVPKMEEYINRGGNIIFTQDMLSKEISFPNIQKILDLYGVSVQNGYIVETDSRHTVPELPYIFIPDMSTESRITADIYTDSSMILVFASRVLTKSDEELANLKVSKQELLFSGENSYFVTDLSANIKDVKEKSEVGKSVISYMMTKNVSNEENKTLNSKLLICSNGVFASEYTINSLDSEKPLSSMESNKDFMLNAIAELTEREGTLTIRKDLSNTTSMPSESEYYAVMFIITAIPIIIILIGIIIWKIRKRRK